MKNTIVAVGLAVAFSVVASDTGWAEPVLILNHPRDINTAEYSCERAEAEIKSDQYAENGIGIAALPHLTDHDLREIGVLLGHRRIMSGRMMQLRVPLS